MNTATVMCDNTYATVSGETGNRGRAAAEPSGEGPQQRFADVLPIARAALEQPSREDPAKEAPEEGGSPDEKDAVDSSVHADPPRRGQGEQAQQDETALGSSQIAGWPFVETVHPAMPRQATGASGVGQPAEAMAEPQATETAATGQTPSSMPATQGLDAGSIPIPAQIPGKPQGTDPTLPGQQIGTTQETASVAQPGVSAGARTSGAVHVATSGEQGVAQPAVTEPRQTAVTGSGQAPAELPLPDGAKPEVPAGLPPTAQEATTAPAAQVASTLPRGTRGTDAGIQSERMPGSPGYRVVNPAPQTEGQDAPVLDKSSLQAQPEAAAEKTGPIAVKTQAVNPQEAASPEALPKPEKSSQGEASEADGRQHGTSKPAAVRSESLKTELAQPDGKDIPSAGPKETAAVVPELRVSPVGESGTSSPRLATQTQTQTSVDAPPARSPVQSIGDQILDSMQASVTRGDRQVLIRLNPPDLGTVMVRFQEQGEYLSGTLEVGNRETRREIENALPQVIRSLQEAGVLIRRVEVVTLDQPDRNSGGNHLSQDVWQQHQGFGQNREHAHASPQTRWSQGAGGQGAVRRGGSEDEPHTAAAPGRLDLLL